MATVGLDRARGQDWSATSSAPHSRVRIAQTGKSLEGANGGVEQAAFPLTTPRPSAVVSWRQQGASLNRPTMLGRVGYRTYLRRHSAKSLLYSRCERERQSS